MLHQQSVAKVMRNHLAQARVKNPAGQCADQFYDCWRDDKFIHIAINDCFNKPKFYALRLHFYFKTAQKNMAYTAWALAYDAQQAVLLTMAYIAKKYDIRLSRWAVFRLKQNPDGFVFPRSNEGLEQLDIDILSHCDFPCGHSMIVEPSNTIIHADVPVKWLGCCQV